MSYPEKNDKEIRLFGDKSIREEAYRQKIFQLEKEIASLEIIAKQQEDVDDIKPLSKPKNLNTLYYEGILSFDKKIKKEQELLEKRSSEITERLDLQVQRLSLSIESTFRRKTRWLFFIIAISVVPLVLMLLFSNAELFSNRLTFRHPNTLSTRATYLKTALSTQTRYRHQYEISSIEVVGAAYLINIELIGSSYERWLLQSIAYDVVNTFKKYSGYAQGEISFTHNGKLYVKANIDSSASKPQLQFFY